jgi:hypothetical protein
MSLLIAMRTGARFASFFPEVSEKGKLVPTAFEHFVKDPPASSEPVVTLILEGRDSSASVAIWEVLLNRIPL